MQNQLGRENQVRQDELEQLRTASQAATREAKKFVLEGAESARDTAVQAKDKAVELSERAAEQAKESLKSA